MRHKVEHKKTVSSSWERICHRPLQHFTKLLYENDHRIECIVQHSNQTWTKSACLVGTSTVGKPKGSATLLELLFTLIEDMKSEKNEQFLCRSND